MSDRHKYPCGHIGYSPICAKCGWINVKNQIDIPKNNIKKPSQLKVGRHSKRRSQSPPIIHKENNKKNELPTLKLELPKPVTPFDNTILAFDDTPPPKADGYGSRK